MHHNKYHSLVTPDELLNIRFVFGTFIFKIVGFELVTHRLWPEEDNGIFEGKLCHSVFIGHVPKPDAVTQHVGRLDVGICSQQTIM